MNEWILQHTVRLAALVISGVPVVVAVLDSLPWEWATSLSAGALTAGEVARKLYRLKTLSALSRPSRET